MVKRNISQKLGLSWDTDLKGEKRKAGQMELFAFHFEKSTKKDQGTIKMTHRVCKSSSMYFYKNTETEEGAFLEKDTKEKHPPGPALLGTNTPSSGNKIKPNKIHFFYWCIHSFIALELMLNESKSYCSQSIAVC